MKDITKKLDEAIDQNDEDLINFDEVSELAQSGMKNPRHIALLMGVDFEIFEAEKDRVQMAIDRGLARLNLEQVTNLRAAAQSGDFQAQKYLLQNIDDDWRDKKDVTNHNEVDPSALPSLVDLFKIGVEQGRAIEHDRQEKEVGGKTLDGDFEEC